MDLFKKSNTNEHTSWDLGAKCVTINHKQKRILKRICNKKARARIKISTKKESVLNHEL